MGYQVYSLTHTGAARKTTEEREFISLSFDGVDIEDFGFIVVNDKDRMTINSIGDFEDSVSQITGRDGQLYWGTTLQPRSIQVSLATDGATAQQIEQLKQHFLPGKIGKLIFTQHPNREIYVRVSAPVDLEVLPFQDTVTQFGRQIQTNVYRGEATIAFIADYPIWESGLQYVNKALSALTNAELKLLYEDGLPCLTSSSGILTIAVGDEDYYLNNGSRVALGTGISGTSFKAYNCGALTAPATVSFTITPTTETIDGWIYINNILNEYSNTTEKYNKITLVQNSNSYFVFQYSLPHLLYSINKCINLLKLFYTETPNGSAQKFEEIIRTETIHPLTKTWAIRVIGLIKANSVWYNNTTGCFISGAQSSGETYITFFNKYMLCLVRANTSHGFNLSDFGSYYPMEFSFNSKTATTILSTSYNIFSTTIISSALEENANDMMRSGYIKIRGNGKLNATTAQMENYTTLTSSRASVAFSLTNFKIVYDYSY